MDIRLKVAVQYKGLWYQPGEIIYNVSEEYAASLSPDIVEPVELFPLTLTRAIIHEGELRNPGEVVELTKEQHDRISKIQEEELPKPIPVWQTSIDEIY